MNQTTKYIKSKLLLVKIAIIYFCRISWETIKFIFKNKLLNVILFFLVLFISYEAIINFTTWLEKQFNPFVSFSTLLISMGIALMNYEKAWEDSLPKTLTVHFTFENNYYLSCYFSDLTSEADIRTWGLQIGSQMVGKKNLSLEPFFDISQPTIIKLDSNKKNSKHYILHFRLSSLELTQGKDVTILDSKYTQWYIYHDDLENSYKLDLKGEDSPSENNNIEPFEYIETKYKKLKNLPCS